MAATISAEKPALSNCANWCVPRGDTVLNSRLWGPSWLPFTLLLLIPAVASVHSTSVPCGAQSYGREPLVGGGALWELSLSQRTRLQGGSSLHEYTNQEAHHHRRYRGGGGSHHSTRLLRLSSPPGGRDKHVCRHASPAARIPIGFGIEGRLPGMRTTGHGPGDRRAVTSTARRLRRPDGAGMAGTVRRSRESTVPACRLPNSRCSDTRSTDRLELRCW
jgi:hypothetical protein